MLQELRGFKIEFDALPHQEKPCRELSLNQKETITLRREIETLLEKEVIVPAEHEPDEFISNVFLREKKDPGKYRMILNLTDLNEFVTYRKFKMDTFETALTLLTPNCYMASLDYTDAYYSLAIHTADRKYLRFISEGPLYEYTSLPNGLSSACIFFTKVVKIPLSVLRKDNSILCTGYLDDSLYVAKTLKKLKNYLAIAADLVQNLGFMISPTKSVIEPTHRI
jgi:hypothetical protein